MKPLVLAVLLAFALPARAENTVRVMSLGGSVTEIIAALGAQDRLVARDTTSNFPESVTALPDVGYVRALSPEGVLSLMPDMIIAEEGAGPPETIDVLKSSGIVFHSIPEASSPDGTFIKIASVAKALDLVDQGEKLAQKVRAGFDLVQTRTKSITSPKQVLFVLSLQDGRIVAGGAGTAAEGIITLAGGINAATGFQGYKPMSNEAVLAAAPDVVLMMKRGDRIIDPAEILAHPALAATPAAAQKAFIQMEGMLLLGFGPRTPEAALALNAALYGYGG